MGWMRWLLAIIRPNDLTQRPVTWSLAACIVSFEWAPANRKWVRLTVYCVTVTNTIMNMEIIVFRPTCLKLSISKKSAHNMVSGGYCHCPVMVSSMCCCFHELIAAYGRDRAKVLLHPRPPPPHHHSSHGCRGWPHCGSDRSPSYGVPWTRTCVSVPASSVNLRIIDAVTWCTWRCEKHVYALFLLVA